VDVCDGVMDKMKYPRGLIRFATQNGLANRWSGATLMRRVLRPRVLIYTAVLLAIVTALGVSLTLRNPFRVDVVRDRGVLAREIEDGRIENVYRLQIMNASETAQRFHLQVPDLPQARLVVTPEIDVGATEARWVAVGVQIPHQAALALGPGVHPMHFEITRDTPDAAPEQISEKSTFVVPR
jgi:polyferredoxin